MRKVWDGSAQATLINTAIDMEQYVKEAIEEAYNQGKEDATDDLVSCLEAYLEDDVKLGCYPYRDHLVGSAYVITEKQLEVHLERLNK